MLDSDLDLKHTGPTLRVCANCGNETSGDFCSHCGQSRKHSSRSLWSLIGDFLNTYLSVDGKLLKTTVRLLFHPGFLTIAYLKDQRVKYLHPVRLYLFVSLVFIVVGGQFTNTTTIGSDQVTVEGVFENDEGDVVERQVVNLPFLSESSNQKLSAMATESMVKIEKDIKEGRFDLVVSKFYQNIPKAFLILLPLFAVILYALLFLKRSHFVDHFIFSIHIHCFFFLSLIILLAVNRFAPAWLLIPFLAWPVYYPFAAVREFGQVSSFKSLMLTSALSLIYLPLAKALTFTFVFATILFEYQ